jgi:hypothetical protein
MKKIQELTNALIQSETQKQVLTKEIQEKDIAIAAFNEISQMLPSLQASVDQMPTLIAKNEELQGTILENEEYIVSVEQALKDAQEIVAIAQTELPLLKAQNEELQASAEQVPILQAKIEELQIAIGLGGMQIGSEPVEPNVTQDLEAKLKLKGEIKGDIRMIKLGIKKGWLEDEIKELLKKTNDEKFEKIKQDILSNSDNLDDSGYDSDLAGDVMNMPDN